MECQNSKFIVCLLHVVVYSSVKIQRSEKLLVQNNLGS